jgi:hypothetical protein
MKYAALVTILLIAAYVGSYVVLVSLPESNPPVYVYVGNQSIALKGPWYSDGERILNYHGLPRNLYAPIHTIDKRWLRHSYWHIPNGTEFLSSERHPSQTEGTVNQPAEPD